MQDIEALRADGIDVPPREVVRLNVFGLRVEHGPESPDVSAAPRVAFLGDAVLREPTLGADMWLRQTADAFSLDDDAQTWFSLRVLSCTVPWRELPDPTRPRAVRKAIKSVLKSLGDATVRQVSAALSWCIDGDLPETGEEPPPKPSDGKGADDEADDLPERYSPEFGLFYRGMAVRVGTAADMKDMTRSAMLAVCDRAEELATSSAFGGWRDRKAEKSRAFGDYMRALDAVREAHRVLAPSSASNIAKPNMSNAQVAKYSSSERQPTEEDSSSSGSVPSSSLRGGPQTKSIGDMAEVV